MESKPHSLVEVASLVRGHAIGAQTAVTSTLAATKLHLSKARGLNQAVEKEAECQGIPRQARPSVF